MSAERVYRRLLIVLPSAFRDEAEAELLETFRQAHARMAGQGVAGRLGFWFRIVGDLAVTSGAERMHTSGGRDPIGFSSGDVMKFITDVQMAVRTLVHQRGFAVPALLTLMLGIGSATAIFSVVNAVLIAPLPYRDPSRLVLIWQELRARNVPEFPFPVGDIPDLKEKGTLLEDVAALQSGRQTISSPNEPPEQVKTAFVTPNTLRLLGLRVAHGRDFDDTDGTPLPPPPQAPQTPSPPAGAAGAAPQAAAPAQAAPPLQSPLVFATILSHEYWQRRFGGDTAVIGRRLDLNGAQADVVGVLAPGAEVLYPPRNNVERAPDLWIAGRVNFATGTRTAGSLRVIGRMKPSVTVAQLQAQMDGLATELRNTYPVKKNAGVHITIVPMHAALVSDVRSAILTLMGAVTFVLLIACANVANLLIAQAGRRERDLAVRTALGAGRGGLVRQMLAESLLLAAVGAAGGIILAQLGIKLLQQIGPVTLPRLQSVAIDVRVLAFTALAALMCAALFGILPALRASRPNVVDVLRRTGRTFGLGAGRLRSGLVIVEVALSFVLLVGSGLMLRSMIALQHVNPGYDPDGILTFLMTNLRAQSPQERDTVVERLRAEIAALPGVTGVAGASPLPLDGGTTNMPYGTEAAASDPSAFQQAATHVVQLGYFETMRAPVLEGRSFRKEDNSPDAAVVIVDKILASRAFPGQPAVGKRLLLRLGGNAPTPFTIVGVVAHERHASLASDGREALFFPDGRNGFGVANRWVVRTTNDPVSLADDVKAAVARVDARIAISEMQPMSAFVDRAQAPTRFALVLTSIFAVIAAVLAVVGLYGVLSTSVRQRTAEIGVRMAFGAERASIFRLIVGRGLLLATIGSLIGVAAALAVMRTVSGLLVGVKASDPPTFVAITVLFLAVSAIACGLPAYRASRLDPTAALRAE
jgi:putative ABC transport system permease protein